MGSIEPVEEMPVETAYVVLHRHWIDRPKPVKKLGRDEGEVFVIRIAANTLLEEVPESMFTVRKQTVACRCAPPKKKLQVGVGPLPV